MSCSACSAHVERAVKKVPGVNEVQVSLLTNAMTVDFNPDTVHPQTIVEAVEKAGYGAEAVAGTQAGASGAAPSGTAEGGALIGAPIYGERLAALAARVADADRVGDKGKAEQRAKSQMTGELKEMKRRLIASACFLLPLFYIAMGHMAGLPLPGFLHGPQNAVNFALAQLLLCLPIIRVNEKYFRVGFASLVRGAPNMDSLIAVGSAAAVGYGVFALSQIGMGLGYGDAAKAGRYAMDLYFESAAMILTLITCGKYLETKAKGRTSEAIARMLELAPETAAVVWEGREYIIPTEEVRPGDILALRPGSKIPVDGVVTEGASAVDQSALTGESIPVPKGPGDPVSAATVNKAGFLLVRAERVGADTTLAQIIRLVEEASASKAPIARLADRIAGVFVPAVMAIAFVTAAVWLFAGKAPEFALSNAISVLVISCPCALGLATPVAIMAGTGRGAEQGILIKSAEAFERAGAGDTVVLDKTGTVTEGKPKVVNIVPLRGIGESRLLSLAASLEKQSEHPLAEAVMEAGELAGLPILPVEGFRALFGQGVEGKIDGEWYWAGNASMMASKGTALTGPADTAASLPDAAPSYVDASSWPTDGAGCIVNLEACPADIASKFAVEGKTPLFLAGEEGCLGVIAVADEVKETSALAVRTLKEMGVDVILLSGDTAQTAEAVRKQLGIDRAIAEVLPQDKENEIRNLQQAGRKTAMIGDGVNDAPALARADVGLAIGAGTDVAIECADIVLMKSDLKDGAAAIQLSRATLRNIRQNLFWAFFYNAAGIPLAAGVFYGWMGWRLNPMFAAAAMSFSSVSVVTNALRLRFFKPRFAGENDK
jgi:Cu+-exporting ATPase